MTQLRSADDESMKKAKLMGTATLNLKMRLRRNPTEIIIRTKGSA
jgi:hypothetical protein